MYPSTFTPSFKENKTIIA